MTRLQAIGIVLAVVLAALLGGCASPPPSATPTPAGPGMMGRYGPTATPGGGDGPGMMGGGGTSPQDGRCAPSGPLPGAVVTVRLADMGMMSSTVEPAPLGTPMMLRAAPVAVPAGQVSLLVVNMGRRPHEVVVLPLADGAVSGQRVPAGDGKVDEAGKLGEVSTGCGSTAQGDGLPAGQSGWTTLTLASGHYELACNLPNHYADGMRQELAVTP